uniref:GTP-binding protein n=1 Tax=Hippocampus comes TaxID=109280 RepID=A0A3Q2XYL8_HIPCM
MTIHTQREKEVLRRRASTPARPTQQQQPPPCAREPCGGASTRRRHPPLGQSASYHLGDTSLHDRAQWSSDSEDDAERVDRVPLLGDHGVGKSSLAGIFAGIADKDDHPEEDTYERTLTVDGKDTTLLILDTWSNDKPVRRVEIVLDVVTGTAYVVVYSVSDRCSFDAAAELCVALRRRRAAADVPIILVGNKSDLVRSREVALQEGRACAMVFDCKFIETSASLQHNVSELFEGVVRQIRLRRAGGSEAPQFRRGASRKRKESVTQKARRFLERLVARNNQHAAVRVRSKSCHDLAVP